MAKRIDNADQSLLKELKKDFERLQKQKARITGGVEGRVLLNLGFLEGEQGLIYRNKTLQADPQRDPNKLNLVFNLIEPRVNKLMGRILAWQPNFDARPEGKDPKKLAEAEVVDVLVRAHDKVVDQPSKSREHVFWLLTGGVSFEHSPWVPNATVFPSPVYDEAGDPLFVNKQTGEVIPYAMLEQMTAGGQVPPEMFELQEELQPVGEVGSEVFGPLNVFLDQTTKSIAELPPDQWIHIAQIKTLGWVKENFDQEIETDDDISIITSKFKNIGDSLGGMYLKDMIPLLQGSRDDTDPDMGVIVQSYSPPSKEFPRGRYVCHQLGKKILLESPLPYDEGEIPITDIHWKPVTTGFWTPDYITNLIPPQKFINKRLSQMGEQANSTIYSTMLLGPGLKKTDVPTDFPGIMENAWSEAGVPLVGRASPPELPNWFIQSQDMVLRLFNDIAGGADLLQESKFPGQLRGPMAVPMLQEILDTEWGPFYEHLGERFSRIKQMRVNRAKQFYPEHRTLHYTDREGRDEVHDFHTEEILRSGTEYKITIEKGTLLPELRSLREERLITRLTGPLQMLYMDERTGRLDKSKIAADLHFGDAARESREAQYRKFSREIIDKLWSAQPVPNVMPFYDHGAMMDELEASMATTEFLSSSQQVQQLFTDRWNQHQQFLAQAAEAQQSAMTGQMVQSAVAQATQQAAAQAAAETVHAVIEQMKAQAGQPTEENVRASFQAEEQRKQGSGRPPAPPNLRGPSRPQ